MTSVIGDERRNMRIGLQLQFAVTRVRRRRAWLFNRVRRPSKPGSDCPVVSLPGEFTRDWFSNRIPTWERILAPLVGRPVHALEVGVFEGRCTVWLLDHVLTHPDATLTWIDPFVGAVSLAGQDMSFLENRFRENTARFEGKVHGYVGRSQKVLRELPAERFDLVYIDGSHRAADVLVDAVLSWPLLRPGGMLVFDDYGWRPWAPLHQTPALAVDAFLAVMLGHFEEVHRGYQVWVRKTG
jgi:predicted O-methyltransferase YrrM